MAKSKKNNKKKAKKNSNYKNAVIEKKVPQKSAKNQQEIERKAKEKEKLKKKQEKEALKKAKSDEKLKRKEDKKAEKAGKNEKVEKTEKAKKIIPQEAKPTEKAKNEETEKALENTEPVVEKLPEKLTSKEEISENVKEEETSGGLVLVAEIPADEEKSEIPQDTSISADIADKTEKEADNEEALSEDISSEENNESLEIGKEEIAEEIVPETEESKTVKSADAQPIVIEKKTENKPKEKNKSKKENKISKRLKKTNFSKIKLTKKNIAILVVAVLTFVALIAVLVKVVPPMLAADNIPEVYTGRDYLDSETGIISINDEQQQANIKSTKAKGNTRKFSFYANTEMQIASPDSTLPISVANPTSGQCVLLFTLADEDGRMLYRSLGITPGKYINNISLTNPLEYGENKLTIYVSAFKAVDDANGAAEYEMLGTQRATIKVTVGKEYNAEG